MRLTFLISVFCVLLVACNSSEPYRDLSFYSDAFETERMYRIYLPKDYEQNTDTRYPVVYYFHGYGGRYKWDSYDLEDDVNYPGNGRKEPPFVMEWKDYVRDNDVIIVTWDGYEPNLREGKNTREGIKYGNTAPYDYVQPYASNRPHWGWDFRLHFRELVQHVDQNFRTLADRDHRGITGLSMGGQTAYFIAGQNRDLVSSVSAFDPADNYAMYGPKGKQAPMPVLEMYRSLKGLGVRLTITDGDWLKYNDWRMKQFFEAADLTHFESHVADYPNHWAADTDKQLDFHMREFEKPHPMPTNWDHASPGFSSFQVWGYDIQAEREEPAVGLLENVSPGSMNILARKFIPDGPILQEEKVSVTTPGIYTPDESYQLLTFNLSTDRLESREITSTQEGKLRFDLEGGGHLVGINGVGPGNGAKLGLTFKGNREYFYFEKGKPSSLDFKLVNLGMAEASNIEITASSPSPTIEFKKNKAIATSLGQGGVAELQNQFDFTVTEYSDSSIVSPVLLEIKVDGAVMDTIKIMAFSVPESPYTAEGDWVVLDGRTVNVPVYQQGPNQIEQQDISGGEGNGNGILEPGEKALVYIRLAQGMGPNDINTFHRTYLINAFDDPFLYVEELDYKEKLRQAGATSVASVISLSEDAPNGYQPELWLKVESLYNDPDDPTSNATIYGHKYDYVRARLDSVSQ